MIKLQTYEVEDEYLQDLLDTCADKSFNNPEENNIRSKPIKSISNEDWKEFEPIIKKNKKYIDEWLDTIIKPNKSSQTLKQYKSCLRQFAFWNENENEGVSFARIRKRAFLRYQNYLLDTGMSKKTLELKRNAVSSFCNFLEIYIAEDDPSYEGFKNFVKGTEIPEGKAKVYDKQPVTYDEFVKVCDRLQQLKLYRLYTIWVCLFYTGKRITEILQLKMSDIRDVYDEFVKVCDRLQQLKLYRLYTIWVCLFYTGKRITEILQLKMSDIRDVPQNQSYIESSPIRGKGRGKEGSV